MADRIGIDFSAQQIDPAAIKGAGIEAVVNYISEARPSAPWMKAVKPMPKDYADRLRAQGIQIVSNYQFGKTGDATPSDWRGGYDAGKRHATIALSNHWKAGGTPWRPCYAPCDDNPTDKEVRELVFPFIKGWSEVWGPEWTGIYCNAPTWEILKALGTPVKWFWQHNWDGKADHPHHPDAHMHQVRIDKDKVGGVGVDWNILLKDDYGQWSKSVNPNPIEVFPIVNLIRTSGVGFDDGNSGRIRLYLHTSEGVDWKSTARGTMQYQASSQTGSYHYLIDDNEIIQTIELSNSAWAVLSDNGVSINVCLVLSSGASGSGLTARENQPKTRAQWLEHTKMLKMLRFLVDDICRKTGIPKTRVDIVGIGQNKRGVSSHNNYTYGSLKLKGYKDGTHWDVPDTFPYDTILTDGSVVVEPADPNAFPLPQGYFYGPLEGPTESISGLANEPQTYIDGLKRWQKAVGIPETGKWDAQTAIIAKQLQAEKKWPNSQGYVYRGEWDAVIREGWRPKKVEQPPLPPIVVPPELGGYAVQVPGAKRCLPLAEGTYVWGSPYGNRDGGFHDGQDFENRPAGESVPVFACQAGTVLYAGAADGYGGPSPAGWVVIDSDDSQGGGCLEYGHVVAEVKPGDKIAVGQRIARINTDMKTIGSATGPHLHLRVWPYAYGDRPRGIDPKAWLTGVSPIVWKVGTTPTTPTTPTAPVTPGEGNLGTKMATKIGDVTGPLVSDKWGVTATDLGAMVRNQEGQIVSVFGDTFADAKVGSRDWRSPVILIGNGDPANRVIWDHAGGPDRGYARQLWNYNHDSSPWRNGGFSTVLPSDLLNVNGVLYLHVMVNKGLGQVLWTEIWKSLDGGHSWSHMGQKAKFSGDIHNGYAQCWAWDYDPEGDWVYIASTGFQRDKGIVLKRVRPADIGDWSRYWNWGWDGKQWIWGTPNPTPITPPDEKWGEIAFRRLDSGKWILGGFLASKYNLSYRVIDGPLADLYKTPLQTLVTGCDWGSEDHANGKVAQLYGGYIVPGSKVDVDGGVGVIVSQWNTNAGWPYRSMQFRGTLRTP